MTVTVSDVVEVLTSAGRRYDDAEQLVAYWVRTGRLTATVTSQALSDGTDTLHAVLASELLPHADRLRRHWGRAARLAGVVDAIVGPLDGLDPAGLDQPGPPMTAQS